VRAHQHEHTRLHLSQAYAQVNAIGPDVDVIGGGQVALAERGVVGLPLLSEPGDRGGRQTGRRAEELLQRRHEVTGGQAMQVEQRQPFADLRGLAAPGRQDRRGEPLALARGLIDPFVVHPRGIHLDRPGRRCHRARLVVAVAHDQAVALLVPLVGQLGYVGVDFCLQCGGQYPPRALTDDLIDQGGAVGGGAVVVQLSTGVPSRPARQRGPTRYQSIDHSGRYASPSRSTGSEHCSKRVRTTGSCSRPRCGAWTRW